MPQILQRDRATRVAREMSRGVCEQSRVPFGVREQSTDLGREILLVSAGEKRARGTDRVDQSSVI